MQSVPVQVTANQTLSTGSVQYLYDEGPACVGVTCGYDSVYDAAGDCTPIGSPFVCNTPGYIMDSAGKNLVACDIGLTELPPSARPKGPHGTAGLKNVSAPLALSVPPLCAFCE
jgi:hypothetical protein